MNKIVATISYSHGETVVNFSTQYPVASDVTGRIKTSLNEYGEDFTIFSGKSSGITSSIGEYESLNLKTTEDDTYIYELVIEQ